MESQAVVLERKIMGVLIRAAREKANRSEKEVAQRLGVTPARVRQYEMGARDISLPELENLAWFFRIPISFFLDGEGMLHEQPPKPPTQEEIRTRRAIVAARLKQARLAAGKTKEDCARAIGRTVATYSRYERGQTDIPITELGRLARLLQVNIYYFAQDTAAGKDGVGILDLEALARLPAEVRDFCLDAKSVPFLRMAMKIRDVPTDKLKELGEILLVVR